MAALQALRRGLPSALRLTSSQFRPMAALLPHATSRFSSSADITPIAEEAGAEGFPGAGHIKEVLRKGNIDMMSPMELINAVPPIQVEGNIAICEGVRNPALGHPVEYINLNPPSPQVCKYCGLRYVQKPHGHGHH
eukprot:TRINITY_DN1712_c0_g1_i1.p1 TRINITY_DN1712_c0_g1~~TRINITY_DN1712_c0_g1_i1.p1  ORF type:complete len:136 (+),score=25.70 TRINITY_DN1712_c0_g1_i1:260-667(+)